MADNDATIRKFLARSRKRRATTSSSVRGYKPIPKGGENAVFTRSASKPPRDDPFQSRVASGSIPGFGGYLHNKATREAFVRPGGRKISGDLGYGPNPFKRKRKR